MLDEDKEDPDSHKAGKVIISHQKKFPEGIPKLPKPWELCGEQANEHWIKMWNDWKSGENEECLQHGLPSQREEEIQNGTMKTLSSGIINGTLKEWT